MIRLFRKLSFQIQSPRGALLEFPSGISSLSSSRLCFQKHHKEMGVVNAQVFLVAVQLLLLVVVGFQRFTRKKKPALTVELARVATPATPATPAIPATWLDNFGEDCVNKLLLETAEPDSGLSDYLDGIEFDEDRQFLRLSEGYRGRPSRKLIKYRCHLANESESFYTSRLVPSKRDPPQSQPPRVRVQDQWLYTVIQPHQQQPDMLEIHSNLMPRQAYLKRLKDVIATGCEHILCTRGFSGISRILSEGEPYHRSSCTECALGEQLKSGAAYVDADLADLWDLEETEMKHHSVLGNGNQGEVHKIYWRKGVFAKKTFRMKPDFDKECEIATEILHPNIVHCFGYSNWSTADSPASLYMELLEESLESSIQDPNPKARPFSFQDIVFILWQVADAMRELHEKRFIHGDLKPGNILLSRLGMTHSNSDMFYLVKVADFGCAQRVPPEGFSDPESADGNPQKFCFGGSTNYTAPEVLKHRSDKIPPKHPEKIDVYSFGVTAYQMLTGVARLYEGLTPSVIKARVINGTLRPSTKCDIKLVSDRKSLFESLVVKCWDSNPESRPPFSRICDHLKPNTGRIEPMGT